MALKERIDTGVRNNPSTGDVLADGGVKINENFDALYNAYGDQRLFDVNFGVGRQALHATGYYQKHPPLYYASNVEIGSRHDVDTSIGNISFRLPQPKVGECIEVINTNGSFSANNPLIVQTESTDSFWGGSQVIRFRTPFAKITFWGISVDRGRGVWRYSIDNMYHNRFESVDIDETISTVGKDFAVTHIDDYRVMKFLTFYQDGQNAISRSSEILLHINSATRTVMHTEYAVVGNTDLEMVQIEFLIVGDNVMVRVKSKQGNNGRFIMKSIESI